MSNDSTISIPIDGKSTVLKIARIPLSKLQMDEENPRIGLYRDNQPDRNLSEIQMRYAITQKSPEAYDKLKESVHNNKGIINPIWIKPVNGGKYLVIEGNSRVVIYQDLAKMEPNESQWKGIIAYVLPSTINEDEKNYIRLQAHLRGTNDWDAYEKSKYLFKLSTEDHWPIKKIEKQTKLSASEISQNIAAFKLMQDQYLPKNPDPNEVSKFSYFVEYVKDNKLKKLMDKNSLTENDFCEWVSDRNMIPTGQDVRRLRDILGDSDSRDLFLNKGFESSMQVIAFRNPNVVDPFYRDMERVIEKLKSIKSREINEISEEKGSGKKRMISELATWSAKVLNFIETS
jgi:hypothetical protein